MSCHLSALLLRVTNWDQSLCDRLSIAANTIMDHYRSIRIDNWNAMLEDPDADALFASIDESYEKLSFWESLNGDHCSNVPEPLASKYGFLFVYSNPALMLRHLLTSRVYINADGAFNDDSQMIKPLIIYPINGDMSHRVYHSIVFSKKDIKCPSIAPAA